MSYNPHYKFLIEFHLKADSLFIPLLTVPERFQWSSLGKAFGVLANLVVASLSGFIYLFTLLHVPWRYLQTVTRDSFSWRSQTDGA